MLSQRSLPGDANPAGRLPYTLYTSADQVPPQDEYDVTKGFTYMYLRGEPLFPFGHGLSYTTFGYANLALSAGKVDAAATVTVSVDVTNTGPRAGDEVVQLYVHQRVTSVKRPARELRGFSSVLYPAIIAQSTGRSLWTIGKSGTGIWAYFCPAPQL